MLLSRKAHRERHVLVDVVAVIVGGFVVNLPQHHSPWMLGTTALLIVALVWADHRNVHDEETSNE